MTTGVVQVTKLRRHPLIQGPLGVSQTESGYCWPSSAESSRHNRPIKYIHVSNRFACPLFMQGSLELCMADARGGPTERQR